MSAIKRFARQIAEKFQPEKIILFGSYAYGTPHNESDVDLLIIMPASNVVNQSIRICLAFKRPFSLDLIVRTPKQIEQGLIDDNWFIRDIVEKGKVLYEARDGEVGSEGGDGHKSGTPPRPAKASTARSSVQPVSASRRKVPQSTSTKSRRPRPKDA